MDLTRFLIQYEDRQALPAGAKQGPVWRPYASAISEETAKAALKQLREKSDVKWRVQRQIQMLTTEDW